MENFSTHTLLQKKPRNEKMTNGDVHSIVRFSIQKKSQRKVWQKPLHITPNSSIKLSSGNTEQKKPQNLHFWKAKNTFAIP